MPVAGHFELNAVVALSNHRSFQAAAEQFLARVRPALRELSEAMEAIYRFSKVFVDLVSEVHSAPF